MRRIVTIILTLLTAVSFAQTASPIFQGSKYYEFRNAVRIDSAFFAPRRDTVITDLSLKAEGMLTYRPQDKTLWYFNGSYWNRIAHGTAFAIDSARLSHDTLYFRYTTGGELAVAMDYYTKEESDLRYVLSPSGRLTANWLTAWDYAISSETPNLSNLEDRYLIVNATAGDTSFTVTGGTGMADFVPNFVAAAFDKTGNHYFSFFVVRQSGSVYNTDRPIKYNLVNDTIKFMWSSYQGQHLSDFGYRGYADMIYDYHKNLASKDYKLYSFYPEDNPTIPFTAIGGAVQGGFIPSTTVPQLYQITTATINYSQVAVQHFIIQQGTAADRGGEWTVNLGKKKGYCETFVGINRNLPGYAKINFYLDGVLKETKFVHGGVQKLTFNYANASLGKLQIVTADAQNTAIRIGRTTWYQTDLDTISKAYKGGKIMFAGDSWTQHRFTGGVFLKSSPERFRARWQADGGDPADIINVGRGGMTSAWGKYWFKYWLNLYHPAFVYIEFYINDSNSSGFVGDPTTTTWNFDSSDPYGTGLDVDGKVTQQNWLDNIKWMKDTALAYGATPIILMPTPTASATQTQAISAWNSALRPASQYYDIETFFTSGVYADNSVTAPTVNSTTGNIDTVVTKVTRGGSASISGSYLMGLRALNSSTTKGLIVYPEVNYTGSLGKILSLQNVPTIGSGEVFSVANNGLTTSAVGFSAGVSGYAIPPFTITYSSGIARISATNSTTVQDLYIGDSLTGVIRFRTPAVLANFTTSTLPTSGLKRVKGALVYDTDVDKAAVTNGSSWEYLAKESLVLARYDSTSAKNNFIRNSAAYAGSPQTADILNLGTMRNDGTLIVNGNARFNLGSDLKWDLWVRDSATGNMTRIPAATYGNTLKAGPGGKPEYVDQSGDFIQNKSIASSAQSGSFNISGQGLIAGTNAYKMFMVRANNSTGNVLAFKTGTDTSGYVGLGSLLNNDVMLVSLTSSVSLRTRDTARIIFGSHSPEYSYVVGKKGKWKFGDSVQTTPTVPIEVESAQDTSILAAHKIIGNGLISNSTITVSSAPAYASGGISPLGKNTTSGRIEAYTPTLTDITTAGNTTSNAATFGGLKTTGALYTQLSVLSSDVTLTSSYATAVGNTASSARILTLPTGVSFAGIMYFVKRSSTANTLTLNTSGGDTFDDGTNTMTVTNAVIVQLQGATWYVLAKY